MWTLKLSRPGLDWRVELTSPDGSADAVVIQPTRTLALLFAVVHVRKHVPQPQKRVLPVRFEEVA